MPYIKWLKDVRIEDIPLVGGKTASLGQMMSALIDKGVIIPNGFALTSNAYRQFIVHNNFHDAITRALALVTSDDIQRVQKAGKEIRSLIMKGNIPDDMRSEIVSAYHQLSQEYNQEKISVAVRSSATAEDLPGASFAGQQDTFLNISGDEALITAIINCMASLFTDRAIVYRIEKGFPHDKVALSVCIQKMIRSDKAVSGVAFSLDTDTGFKDVVMIEASYGLGEAIVQGAVLPDEYMIFKTTFKKGYFPLIKKLRGSKSEKIVYDAVGGTKAIPTTIDQQLQYCLNDQAIEQLANFVLAIEQYYSDKKGCWCPMDVEWAQDADDGKIYIIQARPETVFSAKKNARTIQLYTLKTNLVPLVTGLSIGQKIATGVVRVLQNITEAAKVQKGDIVVTQMTDPDWVPLMKKAAGIITDRGGRTCHAAIVSREFGIPAIVGTHDATKLLIDGQQITIDCAKGSTGYVYNGILPYVTKEVALDEIPQVPVKIMVNIADPDRSFSISSLPVEGVGLARMEFIITSVIKVHPMALIHSDKVVDKVVHEQIMQMVGSYTQPVDFFVDTLARGIGTIAAAFYPRSVIVRTSDFKSNEYRNLIGGTFFEPLEENPMLGFRGACRYYNSLYKEAFALECAAIKKVREQMGLDNVTVMIPFVRTPQEGQQVLDIMAQYGLRKGEHGLRVIMMCEVPSNILLIDEFSKIFDGFSIGSNDLTQLTLAVDRDSPLLASLFDEQDDAVKYFIKHAIEGAHRNNRSIGICGQAPSDYPSFADFLLAQHIDSISLSSDTVIPFLVRYKDHA